MSAYELAIGAPRDDSSSDVYTDFEALDVTQGASSMDSWNATLPFDATFEDDIFEDVFIYYDGELIFRGELEHFETDYEAATTAIGGRGALVELDRSTDIVSYTDTTVYDALKDYWSQTSYDATVLPPNRDVYDGTFATGRDHRQLWGWEGSREGSILEDNWRVHQSRLEQLQPFYTNDMTIDVVETDVGFAIENSNYSKGEGIRFEEDAWGERTTEVDYPISDYRVWIRMQTSQTDAVIRFYVDGVHVSTADPSGLLIFDDDEIPHDWYDATGGDAFAEEEEPPEIDGETTFRIEVEGLPGDGSEWVDIEAGSITDERFDYTLADDLNEDNVYERPYFYPHDERLDDDSAGTQYPAFRTDQQTDWIGTIVETDRPVQQFDVGLKRMDGESVLETVWETISHETPQHVHHLDFTLAEPGDEFRLMIETDPIRPDTQLQSGMAYSVDVRRAEVFAPDKDGFVSIDDVEIEGTKFEILQELHELGSYDFSVTDYGTREIHTFPVGTLHPEPDWRIISSTRSRDFTDYANRVTVHGRTLDDGTTNTATADDQSEIDDLDRAIEKFEKNTDLETQAEVDSRAERLLEESINERDESGTLEIVPQMVAPGYSYTVSAWGDAFRYGPQIGLNALYFDGADDNVEFDYSYDSISSSGTAWTWEFLIHPEGLVDLPDEDYYTLLAYRDDTITGEIRIYGDGSVEFGETGSDAYLTRTEPNVVKQEQSQRLSIVWGRGTDRREVYVDGQLEASFTDYDEPVMSIDEYVEWWLGSDTEPNNHYQGGLDDVRLWTADTAKSQDWIFEHRLDDLVETGVDVTNLPIYFRFDDASDSTTAVNDGNTTDWNSTIDGAEYQDTTGQLEEVQFSLGTGETLTLDFDISGRIDTELVRTQRVSRANRRSL